LYLKSAQSGKTETQKESEKTIGVRRGGGVRGGSKRRHTNTSKREKKKKNGSSVHPGGENMKRDQKEKGQRHIKKKGVEGEPKNLRKTESRKSSRKPIRTLLFGKLLGGGCHA